MSTQAKLKTLLASSCIALLICASAHAKSKYVCDDPDPASLCRAANTCGSASAPCTVNINKSGNSSTVKPSVPECQRQSTLLR